MTTTLGTTEVHLRQPLPARIWVGLFLIVWSVGLIVFAVRGAGDGGAAWLVPLVMLVAGWGIGYRTFRLGVDAAGDILTVRNSLQTLRLPRSQITGFRVGAAGRGMTFGSSVYVDTLEGMILLQGTARLRSVSAASKQDDRLARLEAWRRSGS
jgi:hypothetical protein